MVRAQQTAVHRVTSNDSYGIKIGCFGQAVWVKLSYIKSFRGFIMKLKSFFLFIILLLSGVFVYSQEVAPVPVNPQDSPHTRGYTIGPGDQVAGTIHGEMGYDFVVNVDQDGMIIIPFVKRPIVAQCKTERELKAEIELEIKKYLRDPSFAFRVSERRSRPPVTVYGEINNPSAFMLTRKATLLEILAAAGGAKEQEASGLVEVRRPRTPMCMATDDKDNWTAQANNAPGGTSRSFRLADINLGREDSNPVIYPGDMILVQRAAPVYITGEVVAPQGVFLKERGLSLTEGLAQVGNVREKAKKSKINILRLKPGASAESKDRELIFANLDLIAKGKEKDIMLQPFDIVVVDKAKDPIGLAILNLALNAGKTFAYSTANVIPARIVY